MDDTQERDTMTQEDQSRDIKAQLRSLLVQDASLREKYLDPPTHLSSFIGTEGQHIGFYKHPENNTLFVEIGRLKVVNGDGDTKMITLNNIAITKGNFKGFIQDPLGLSEILELATVKILILTSVKPPAILILFHH